mmetsp:Transcript_72209/g.182025  ORF Transcript_72209/g.182025 Transcript_72209/m.182025 type:complete len:223 (+) Transcript_72209:3137-3805(+)
MGLLRAAGGFGTCSTCPDYLLYFQTAQTYALAWISCLKSSKWWTSATTTSRACWACLVSDTSRFWLSSRRACQFPMCASSGLRSSHSSRLEKRQRPILEEYARASPRYMRVAARTLALSSIWHVRSCARPETVMASVCSGATWEGAMAHRLWLGGRSSEPAHLCHSLSSRKLVSSLAPRAIKPALSNIGRAWMRDAVASSLSSNLTRMEWFFWPKCVSVFLP